MGYIMLNIITDYKKYKNTKEALIGLSFYKSRYVDDGEEWYYTTFIKHLHEYDKLKKDIDNNYYKKKLDGLEKVIFK